MEILQENVNFFNKIAKYYDKILGFWLNRVFKRLLKEINIENNSVILDAGCGTGNLLNILSKNKTFKLYGVDISPKMLEIAKMKLKNRAKLSLISVEKINYRNKFDYIFSTEAFHHYESQEKAMKKFNLALKKNGKLIITDLSFGRILNLVFNKLEPGNSKMNSKKEFYKLFKKYKFKNVKQKKLGLFIILTVGEKD